MTQRVNYAKESPALFKKFIEFATALREGAIEEPIRDLVAIRASQTNGCGFCLDMHIKQAKIHGHLAAWRESTLFAPRERAALISDLTFLVMSVNAWNRINIGFKSVPGSSDATFGLDKAKLN